MTELIKYKIGKEIKIKDMQPEIVYVQKFLDYFMCKGKTLKEKCFAVLIDVSDTKGIEEGINSVKNSIITSDKVGYRRFLRLLDTEPRKLPFVTKDDREKIKVVYL